MRVLSMIIEAMPLIKIVIKKLCSVQTEASKLVLLVRLVPAHQRMVLAFDYTNTVIRLG